MTRFNISDTKISMSKRGYAAQHLWYFKGRKPKYNWAWENDSKLLKLHDSHYHQTTEYKTMVSFFDSIDHLKPAIR